MTDVILCPECPVCGQAPRFAMSPQQAFCDNNDCGGFSWNMTHSLEQNRANVSYHCIRCGTQLESADSVCPCPA